MLERPCGRNTDGLQIVGPQAPPAAPLRGPRAPTNEARRDRRSASQQPQLRPRRSRPRDAKPGPIGRGLEGEPRQHPVHPVREHAEVGVGGDLLEHEPGLTVEEQAEAVDGRGTCG